MSEKTLARKGDEVHMDSTIAVADALARIEANVVELRQAVGPLLRQAPYVLDGRIARASVAAEGRRR